MLPGNDITQHPLRFSTSLVVFLVAAKKIVLGAVTKPWSYFMHNPFGSFMVLQDIFVIPLFRKQPGY